MDKGAREAGEAPGWQGTDALLLRGERLPFVFQGEPEDAFEATDVNEVEA